MQQTTGQPLSHHKLTVSLKHSHHASLSHKKSCFPVNKNVPLKMMSKRQMNRLQRIKHKISACYQKHHCALVSSLADFSDPCSWRSTHLQAAHLISSMCTDDGLGASLASPHALIGWRVIFYRKSEHADLPSSSLTVKRFKTLLVAWMRHIIPQGISANMVREKNMQI